MRGRRELLLKEAVDQYIRTRRPISSRGILEEYRHPFSSATVRNELAALERGGYLYKPYPSSGRIPTRAGFRFFAEWLLELGELQERPGNLPAERAEIAPQQLPELLRRTALLLASMTGQMGFVLAPPVEDLQLAGLVMRQVAPRAVLVVVLSQLGVVESRILRLQEELASGQLEEVERLLSQRLRGMRLRDLDRMQDLELDGWQDPTVVAAVGLLQSLAAEELRRRLYGEGLAHLLRGLGEQAPDAALHRICGLVRLLEDERRFAALIEHLRAGESSLAAHVGADEAEELADLSVITAPYLSGGGVLGVIGPLWLDYARAFSAIRYVAGRLAAILVFAEVKEGVER